MTPQQIEDAARRKYNSYSSSFFAQAEIWDLIYQAELEIARETKMLEGNTVISGGSVLGTQSYAYPTGVLEVKRVQYDGARLEKIDFRDDDDITLFDANDTAQGTPLYYYDWEKTIYLRPVPDTSSLEIRLFYYKEPTIVTSASQTLEVPTLFHMCIADYVVGEMAAKDQNAEIAQLYLDKWYNRHIPSMKAWTTKRKTGDKFKVVREEGSFR